MFLILTIMSLFTTVYVQDDSANTTPAVQGCDAPSAPVFPPVAVSEAVVDAVAGKESPTERMRELDQMKGLTSEDEYQQKRADTLPVV